MRIKNIIKLFNFFFEKTFYFVLRYSQLTMSLPANSEGTRPYVYILSILLQTPLPSRLPYNIEQSPLCYTLG